MLGCDKTALLMLNLDSKRVSSDALLELKNVMVIDSDSGSPFLL
jgi:hypothetical protein